MIVATLDSMIQLSTFDGENGYWVVPANGARRGLMLEYWTLDGERMVNLERQVPWLPAGGYPPIAGLGGEGAGEPELPEYDMLHIDSQGLIRVVVVARDARWRYLTGPEKQEMMDELYDALLEVIDPIAGEVLVSYRYDGPSQELPPFSRFIPGTSRSYRTVEGALGDRTFEIVDVRLVEASR